MKNITCSFLIGISMLFMACNSKSKETSDIDKAFATFETVFLDAYWAQYPVGAIYAGYGKYYDRLIVYDSASFAGNVAFSNAWLDSLKRIDFQKLNENNKISFHIIEHQLKSDIWYTSVFKERQWDASLYNMSGACDYIINQPYAILDERLRILSRRLQRSQEYYDAALKNLERPMKGHVELAILQNEGGLSVFGKSLTDSINASHLTNEEKATLNERIEQTKKAIAGYVTALKAILADKNYVFRDFRIGKELFTQKFGFDLATDLSPETVYARAMADKHFHHRRMFAQANKVWEKYYPGAVKPADSFQLIQLVINKIQLNHAKPADFFDSVKSHVSRLKKFILEKDLFDFDTSAVPIVVRYTPAYSQGFTSASAEFIPPYQKQGTAYYNVDNMALYEPGEAESALREDNNYASQMLSIHEAVPGHCMQSVYNNRKSPDVLRAVFQNGAMIEGWANYTEDMMIENGWGDHSPEIELILGTWKLRELANVIIDYDIQCLNKPESDIVNFLTKECFQTTAQVKQKYHRATLSQVQLCSYFTGATAIQSLHEEYKKKMGDRYTLKNFHESFLGFGSSPIKYIREQMLR